MYSNWQVMVMANTVTRPAAIITDRGDVGNIKLITKLTNNTLAAVCTVW
jgi:hypothetical protein